MKWEGQRESENVEDRRGMGGGRILAGGGIGTVVIIVLALFFGVDPRQLLDQVGTEQVSDQSGQPYQETPEEAQRSKFARVVLADTEDTWSSIFQAAGKQYEKPKLVFFSGSVDSACGFAQAAMGPFYCPNDHKVYLDLSFFDDMDGKLQAGGDFAKAYVIAHEIGHHVQNLLGTMDRVAQLRAQGGEDTGTSGLSVRTELQADCLAGVWANHTETQKKFLEAGDIDEAMNAAAAVGDDRLQKRGQGYVVPESFTHGSSEQRARWFRKGLDSGDTNQCDTFGASTL